MNNDCNIILVRGVSGAGKSTIGEMFDDGATTRILSTDDLFYVDGEYNFDPSKLAEYHQAIIDKVESLMVEYDWKIMDHDYAWFPIDRIVVCNTFTQMWEMEPYFNLAKKYDWCIHTIIVENRHDSDSIHKVPADTILQQKDRFEVIL